MPLEQHSQFTVGTEKMEVYVFRTDAHIAQDRGVEHASSMLDERHHELVQFLPGVVVKVGP